MTALVADVHPEHAASQAVARRLGLRATAQVVDDEVRWASAGDATRADDRHLRTYGRSSPRDGTDRGAARTFRREARDADLAP